MTEISSLEDVMLGFSARTNGCTGRWEREKKYRGSDKIIVTEQTSISQRELAFEVQTLCSDKFKQFLLN